MKFTALWIAALCLSGVYAVFVETRRTVICQESQKEVTLPCSFVLDNPKHVFSISWSFDWVKIFKRDSNGKDIFKETYKDRVRLSHGCSLTLLDPRQNDTGMYTVSVLVPDDVAERIVSSTQLTVLNDSVRVLKDSATVSTPSNLSEPKDGNTTVEIVSYSLMGLLAVLTLVHQIVLLRKDRERRRNRFKLLVGGLVLLFLALAALVVCLSIRHRDYSSKTNQSHLRRPSPDYYRHNKTASSESKVDDNS